jgi:hypothetical protein
MVKFGRFERLGFLGDVLFLGVTAFGDFAAQACAASKS